MTNAQDRGWGAPGGLGREDLLLVDCPGIPLRVRAEVAPLFTELVRWLVVERTRTNAPPLSSAGGYNPRKIAGTSKWSNHAWGLAADFNAATNPYSRRGTTDMPPGTSAKAKSLGMRWGGDYTGKRDAMHFEFMGTPADAARLVAALRAGWTKSRPGVTVTDRIQAAQEDPMKLVWDKPARKVWLVDHRGTKEKVDAINLDLFTADVVLTAADTEGREALAKFKVVGS